MTIVIETYIVLITFQAIGIYLFADVLSKIFTNAPVLTINILSSSAISPVLALIYIGFRKKFIPNNIYSKETITVSLSGIVLTWLICIAEIFIFGKRNIFIENLLSTSSIYYYVNLLWFVIWAPFVEESLFRGYIYELLRFRGEIFAILISSLLFSLPHAIFSGYSPDVLILIEICFIFIRSVVFTIMYKHGGLLSAIICHSFANLYFVLLNAK